MIYILYGKIDYLIKKEIQKITTNNKIDDFNISSYDLENDNISDIINDASTISLFDNKKVIIVYNSYIFTGSTAKHKFEQNITVLEEYLNNINSNTILIFIVNNEKLDERKKIVKLIKKVGTALEFNQIDTKKIVKDLFEDYQISSDLINYLINRVGNDLMLLNNEIAKLKLYKDNDKNITKDDINKLINKNIEIDLFKLIEAIIIKDKETAITIYREMLKLNEEPIAIIITLANQIRIIYQTKELYQMGHTEHDIATILNIHPFRVKKAAEKMYDYDSKTLLSYLYQLAELDLKIKSGLVDKELGLELFILQI